MKQLLLTLALLILFPLIALAELVGSITGTVYDVATNEPLQGTTVQVTELHNTGSVCDEHGNFKIEHLPVGKYSLRISLSGYTPVILTNVVVSTGRSTKESVGLKETSILMNEVTVTADYFRNGTEIAPLSSIVLESSELKRNPGSFQDVQRIVQILPGIGSSTDRTNELIVRGGSPNENLTILDYIEIPSTNHYPNQFNSSGPINMVNADLVEDIEFSAGGFTVPYGDKLSSIMRIKVREGDRARRLATFSTLNLANMGILGEGRINGGRGSYIVSARESFFEILDRVVGLSAVGLTAIPKYYDLQGKMVYDLNPYNKLMLNAIYGNDRILEKGKSDERDPDRANTIDSSTIYRADIRSEQYAAGLSWQQLWGKRGFGVLTVGGIGNVYDQDVRSLFHRREFDSRGEVVADTILSQRLFMRNLSRESFLSMNYEANWRIDAHHDFQTGAQIQTSNHWNNYIRYAPDTSRYDLDRNGSFETGPIALYPFDLDKKVGLGKYSKSFAYVQDKWTPRSDLSMTLGLRYDYFSYTKDASVAPRFNTVWQLRPGIDKLTFAWGHYYQTPPFPDLGDQRDLQINRYLKNLFAQHFVIGYEHILDEGRKFTFETYYKQYRNMIVSEQFIYSAIDTLRTDKNRNAGNRYSYGAELFFQQKQVHDYYGTLSLSWSESKMMDPRIPKQVTAFSSDFDFPWIVVASGGRIVRNVRSRLNEMPFYVKYPAYLLPLSNEMDIGFKFRYQTGKPYTPMEFVTWRQIREGGIKWSKGAWEDAGAVNSVRYPDYHRLDLQWLSRYRYDGWSMNVTLMLNNVYNQKNVSSYYYRTDGTRETVYQFAFFPVLGVEIEY